MGIYYFIPSFGTFYFGYKSGFQSSRQVIIIMSGCLCLYKGLLAFRLVRLTQNVKQNNFRKIGSQFHMYNIYNIYYNRPIRVHGN